VTGRPSGLMTNILYAFVFSHTCYMPLPYPPNLIVLIMFVWKCKLWSCWYSCVSFCYSLSHSPAQCSETYSSPSVRVPHPYGTAGKIMRWTIRKRMVASIPQINLLLISS
jgi:hypothetical protein